MTGKARKTAKVHNFECCCDKPFELTTGIPGAIVRVETLPGADDSEVNYNANDEIVSIYFPHGVNKCRGDKSELD